MNKTDLLFQMMEEPQAYTDKLWQEILSDDECRELYTLMAKTRSAVDVQKEIDDETIDAEWKRLTAATDRRSRIASLLQLSWCRVAAMFIGVLLISGIAFAAIHIVRNMNHGDVSPDAGQGPNQGTVILQLAIEVQDSTLLKPVVFEDAELESILSEIATYYNYKVTYKCEEAQHTRLYYTWDRQMPIEEIIETFNQFKRIHVTAKDRWLFVE